MISNYEKYACLENVHNILQEDASFASELNSAMLYGLKQNIDRVQNQLSNAQMVACLAVGNRPKSKYMERYNNIFAEFFRLSGFEKMAEQFEEKS